MRRRPDPPFIPALIPALIAVVLVLTACIGSSGGDDGPRGGGGRARITVGIVPVIDTAPLFLGIEKGFFANRGLDVTPVPAPGGAVVVPAVLTQQNQFGFSNVVSLLAARDAGLPLAAIAGGSSSTGSVEDDFSAVLVKNGSSLRRPRDLEGKTVAINSLNNIGDTTIRTAVEKDGGDPKTVKFIELPLPEMPAQLSQGRVDAVWTSEPFRSQILGSGGRVLFNNLVATHPRLQLAQYFTSEEFKAENPGVVDDFVSGLNESMTYASEHPDEAREILLTYTRITREVADSVVLPDWPLELNRESTLALGVAARKYGTIDSAPDIQGLLGVSQ
jgi:NitT/TauT family transport system substrate-binding protein